MNYGVTTVGEEATSTMDGALSDARRTHKNSSEPFPPHRPRNVLPSNGYTNKLVIIHKLDLITARNESPVHTTDVTSHRAQALWRALSPKRGPIQRMVVLTRQSCVLARIGFLNRDPEMDPPHEPIAHQRVSSYFSAFASTASGSRLDPATHEVADMGLLDVQ